MATKNQCVGASKNYYKDQTYIIKLETGILPSGNKKGLAIKSFYFLVDASEVERHINQLRLLAKFCKFHQNNIDAILQKNGWHKYRHPNAVVAISISSNPPKEINHLKSIKLNFLKESVTEEVKKFYEKTNKFIKENRSQIHKNAPTPTYCEM